MHKTTLGVIALAVGALILIGLFNVYRPQVTQTTDNVFQKSKVKTRVTNMNAPDRPSGLKDGFALNNSGQAENSSWEWKPKGSVHIAGKTNQDGLWELVTKGQSYNMGHVPSGPWAQTSKDSGEQLEDTLVTKDGKTINYSDIG